jgi:hypothetical protein
MKKIIFFVLLFISACSEKPVEIPADVISKDEMAKVLTDITLAQSAYSTRLKTDTIKYRLNDYVNQVLIRHSLEKEKFLVSLKFYSEHPKVLQQVYDSVITGLSKMQGETELN